MTTSFIPEIRKPNLTVVPASTSSSLIGMTLDEVVAACQWKITSGKGTERGATGATFLNAMTARLFVTNREGTELHQFPNLYANFDNREDSVAVQLAEHLSKELLETGAYSQLQYFFSLYDSKTKKLIAGDRPEYERTEEEDTSNLPDFLKPNLADVLAADTYTPDPKICAFLHIYVEHKGRPVRVASNDIEARHAPSVNKVRELVEAGHHFQAGVAPQTKVEAWLRSLHNEADRIEESLNMNDFTAAAADA